MTALSTLNDDLDANLDLKAFETIFPVQNSGLLQRFGLLKNDSIGQLGEEFGPEEVFQSFVQFIERHKATLSASTCERFRLLSEEFHFQALTDDRYRDLAEERGFAWQVDVASMIFRHFGSCRSIVIPWWVVVLGNGCFYECKLAESVVFESGSQLERIGETAFCRSGLKSIVIPSSTIVLGNSSFADCESLASVIFERGSRLERIDERAFFHSGLKSIVIPSSTIVLGNWSFAICESLKSVIFESGCQLEEIDVLVFAASPISSCMPSGAYRKGCFLVKEWVSFARDQLGSKLVVKIEHNNI
jgi:hypothetical protein